MGPTELRPHHESQRRRRGRGKRKKKKSTIDLAYYYDFLILYDML